MAEDSEDPREVDWHPRKARRLLGHAAAEQQMRQAFASATTSASAPPPPARLSVALRPRAGWSLGALGESIGDGALSRGFRGRLGRRFAPLAGPHCFGSVRDLSLTHI